MSAHLAGGGAARRPEPLRPFHHARRADAQRPRDHPHALACLNPRQSTFAQIHRIGFCHPPKASDSLQFLNQKPGNLGIPTDSAKFHPALMSAGIRLFYKTHTKALAGLRSGVLLELGFDDVTPNAKKDIGSWLYDYAADKVDIIDNRAKGVACY